ncbi:MAG: hypothetical protein C4289_00245 [Chloroflexota bacterium]
MLERMVAQHSNGALAGQLQRRAPAPLGLHAGALLREHRHRCLKDTGCVEPHWKPGRDHAGKAIDLHNPPIRAHAQLKHLALHWIQGHRPSVLGTLNALVGELEARRAIRSDLRHIHTQDLPDLERRRRGLSRCRRGRSADLQSVPEGFATAKAIAKAARPRTRGHHRRSEHQEESAREQRRELGEHRGLLT